jgi:hypothetical protein
VHGPHNQPFTNRVSAPEEPGRFCYPPIAAVLTAGARLLLALLERCVTDQGGTWAIADTDSMAIVATARGGLIDCPGGPNLKRGKPAVRALSYAQVDQIRERFASLNPHDQTAAPGTILKAEVDAYCYAIAAKRYALCRLDEHGQPRLVPASEHHPCSHGLGHLLNPIAPDTDPDAPDWITQLWEHELALVHGVQASGEDAAWYDQPALARSNVTSPELLGAFAKLNKGKRYADQVKPFNFLSSAPGAQPPAGHNDPAHFRLGAALRHRHPTTPDYVGQRPRTRQHLPAPHRPEPTRNRDSGHPPHPRRPVLQPHRKQIRRPGRRPLRPRNTRPLAETPRHSRDHRAHRQGSHPPRPTCIWGS